MTPKGAGRRVEWYDRLWPIVLFRCCKVIGCFLREADIHLDGTRD